MTLAPPRLLHGEKHDAVVLFGVVGQDGDDEVGVEGVEVSGGLVEEEDDGIADELGVKVVGSIEKLKYQMTFRLSGFLGEYYSELEKLL